MATKVKVKIAPKTGDPAKGVVEEKAIYSATRPKQAVEFDIRDRLSALVGKGNALLPDDKASIYSTLVASLGEQKARKIMDHAYLFNQRPDVQQLPVEDKLRAFYTIGSNDPDVGSVIARSKSLGYGPLQGFRTSSDNMNQQLAGRIPATGDMAVDSEIKKRVMVKVKK